MWSGCCQIMRSSCRQEHTRVQYLLIKVDPLQQSVTLHYHNFLLLLNGDEGHRPPGYQQTTELAGRFTVPGPSSVLSIFATHFIWGWSPTVPHCVNMALLGFLSLKLTFAQRRQYKMVYHLNPIYTRGLTVCVYYALLGWRVKFILKWEQNLRQVPSGI